MSRVLAVLALSFTALAAAAAPRLALETSLGTVVVELDAERAPASARNFLAYARADFYDGTLFHRVIPGFMVQGGGLTEDLIPKPTRAAIENEADNGLANVRGTLAMARTGDPHSANSQFFINLVDNAFLDHRAKTPQGWGYAVFGRVVEGMDVVDAIAATPTGVVDGVPDVPLEPVVLIDVREIGAD